MYQVYFNPLENASPQKKNKFKKYNMHYLKQLKNYHEMIEAKATNIRYRNNILARQKIANYKNEKDRIQGLIDSAAMRSIRHVNLEKRKHDLDEMIKNIN